MREILFRGKRRDTGEWVEGSLVRANGLYTKIINGEVKHNDFYDIHFYIDPETVGQFTGVLDANGKKVFEGDIVKLTEDVKKTFGVNDGVVKFNHSAFFVNGRDGFLDSLFVLVDYTYVLRGWVIGNIHDNPELLEVK